MKSFTLLSLFILSQFYSLSALSDDSISVRIDDIKIYLNNDDLSEVILENLITGNAKKCKISNSTEEDTKNGNGFLRITTDKKAIILFSSHRYLLMNELNECSNGKTKLYSLPNSHITMLQDINFENKLFLQFSLEDKDSWLASISHFGSNINLLRGEGFYNPKNKKKEQGFSLGYSNGDGQISTNGKYVVVNDFNCQEGKIPTGSGVWNIKSNKRVIFPTKIDEFGRIGNSDEILEKCIKVFEGTSTIQQLGGTLGL
ncbi:hypothetical protein [Yersinia wautersii]|uniref:Uncharacterized protein n=1 Tax=Yersinia wautersii TaxID=1341643 RepID=A0ABM9TJV3_9GAMM|nr:hypothetical protein [Yersinia wautersii]CRG52255.1 Uncharacterised protein [Yersinia wautersii]